MTNTKDDLYFLDKIIYNLQFIAEHTKNISLEDLTTDLVLQDSILFRIIQISENCKNLSKSFLYQNKSVPWKLIIGTRNRIVHDYGDIDLKIIFSIIKDDVPIFLEQVLKAKENII